MFLVLGLFSSAPASVTLNHKDAVVWSRQQTIAGRVNSFYASFCTLRVNGTQIVSAIGSDSTFAIPISLHDSLNTIFAVAESAGVTITSDTLRYTLGSKLMPVVCVSPTVDARTVALHVQILENPDNVALAFAWTVDPGNPSSVAIIQRDDSTASVSFPEGAAMGEYYFNVAATDSEGDTVHARTLVTVDSADIHPFHIRTDHARWIDAAIIYGVTPYIFVSNGRYSDITQKIPELMDLGINTLWLQPTYSTHGGGQGYDLTDFFSIRNDLGSSADLHDLVNTAHSYGLKVLFDFVPNHTSIYHPYAQDAITYGRLSHYYDFYQRAKDTAPYSNNENIETNGNMTFVYYFWNELVNLNYDNPEVRRMMIEAGRKWIEEFDIDGYRVDAAWGPNARRPDFMKEWRFALKSLKPEVLLLAEDKASQAQVFDEKFDAAYDWTKEYGWVSHWVWNTQYDSPFPSKTIFNFTPENERANAFRNSITNSGSGYATGAKILRYLENNDTYRFLATHDLDRTKMAATTVFTLDGIPLLYNGQEIGALSHPYQTFQIFQAGSTIRSRDMYGLFPLYQHLSKLRTMFPALSSGNRAEVQVIPNTTMYAYHRWEGDQHIFTVMNMGSTSMTATVILPVSSMNLDPVKTYYLTDLVTNEYISGTTDILDTIPVALNQYTARSFILADSVVAITGMQGSPIVNGPTEYRLEQNYPNPFNSSTVVSLVVSRPSFVSLKVYDVLGREVATLVNEMKHPGKYTVQWNADGAPSGVYFYRMQSDSETRTRKMILLK